MGAAMTTSNQHSQQADDAALSSTAEGTGPPWHILLEHIWAHLGSEERASVVECCKEAFFIVRTRLQSEVKLLSSRALAEQLDKASATLQSRFPYASHLALRFDKDHLEDVDGAASADECNRAASSVLQRLGNYTTIKECGLYGWETVSHAAMTSLLGSLPSLEGLAVTGCHRLDLEVLLLPQATSLTALEASATNILMDGETLHGAPPLQRLRHLQLSGLQINDQRMDNELCLALGALTCLTLLELATFSAATRTSARVALSGVHNETLRTHPLARLGPSLACMGGLTVLRLSDPHLELRTGNSMLAAIAGLPALKELEMPEARVREEGWHALQQLTSVTNIHLYSIELKGQTRAAAPGSVTWWRRLRLEDTCLPELASIMPVPGLERFVGTLFMRYGDGPVPPREFRGLDQVMACLGAAGEVRLWLELDCDIWPGLSRILGQLPGLQEVVVRARHPHPLQEADLAALLAQCTRLHYLDISSSELSDEGLVPLHGLPLLTKVCLGLAEREGQEGHTALGVQQLAASMAARRRPALIVAPHLNEAELEELEQWQAQDPHPPARGGPLTQALAERLAADMDTAEGGAAAAAAAGGGGAVGGGGATRSSGAVGTAAGAFTGVSAPGRSARPAAGEALVLLSNEVADYFQRMDL